MRRTTTLFNFGLLFVAVASGLILYSVTRGAQAPTLAERIARLKAEINSVPTNAGNHAERVQTARDWGDDLTRRGRFLTQQDLNLTFIRLSEPSPQLDAAIKQWIKTLTFLEEKGDAMGAVARADRNELIAGQYSTIALEYTVGATEIQKGGAIRVGQNFFNNRVRLQTIDPAAESYVSFKVESKTAQTKSYVASFMGIYSNIFGPVPMPGLRVTSGALKSGDKVTITIGDKSRGSFGYRVMTRDSDDFPFMISADFNGDGVIIPVARAPADAQVKVIVSELIGTAGGTGASGYVVRPPGPPSRKPIHEVSFKVSEAAQKQADFNPAPNMFIYARKARANAPWDVSFSYRPTKAPAQDDYYYLRVVQIDGEVAWVSPVWIGEQSSAKKGN